MSTVDVFIPCYKYGRYLQSCLQSVLSQEGVAVRALIIDDASPDDSAEVGARLARADARVEFRRHPTNRGHIETYNEGLEWARAEYALLLSADDALTPGSLSRATRLMDQHPEVGVTYGAVIRTPSPETEQVTKATGPSSSWVIPGREYIAELCRTGHNVIATPAAVVRTTVQRAVGGYRKELPHAGDMEMWLRFAAFSDVGYVDAVQAYYRWHGQNMTDVFGIVGDIRQRMQVFATLFDLYADRIPDAASLRELVFENLCCEALGEASKAFDNRDLALCEGLLDCAREQDPMVRRRREWKCLRLKHLMGVWTWETIRPLVRFGKRLGGWTPPVAVTETPTPDPTAGTAAPRRVGRVGPGVSSRE